MATPIRRLGKYHLIARIGEGGMAEVYLAHMRGPRNFRKVVVVKTIHPDLASQEQFLEMLLDEARLSALIKHPRVVDIYDLGHADGTYFIAMEYLDGQPLSAVMTAGVRGNALDPYSLARIIADAAEGLNAAHELTTMSGRSIELVHRDVSPGNIIVQYDGNVKIVDFGIAKARGRLHQSGVRQLKGKLGYMSPEQLTGQPVDRRSDVFSLGVVFWEVLALKRLFVESAPDEILDRARKGMIERPSTLRPQVPPQLDEICMRAMAPEVSKRYQTATEMKQAIDQVLREAGYFRDTETIPRYMAQTFARRRAERAQLLRLRGNTSSEMDSIPEESADAPPRTGELIGPTPRIADLGEVAAAARQAEAEAMAAAEAEAQRSWWRRAWDKRWPVVAAGGGALVLLAAVAVVAFGGGGRTPAGDEPRMERRTDGMYAPLPGTHLIPAAGTPAETPAAPVTPPVAETTQEIVLDSSPTKTSKPRNAVALFEEGTALFVAGKAGPAKEKFKDAIAADPNHAPSYRGLGFAYQALGKSGKAVSAFEKYLRLKPNASDAAAIRARIAKMKP